MHLFTSSILCLTLLVTFQNSQGERSLKERSMAKEDEEKRGVEDIIWGKRELDGSAEKEQRSLEDDEFRFSERSENSLEAMRRSDDDDDELVHAARAYSRTSSAKGCKRNELGKEYTGKLTTTASGYTCQSWISHHPHKHTDDINAETNKDSNYPDGSVLAAKNYCRNPDNTDTGPWCYTTDANKRWESCDIPLCPNNTDGCDCQSVCKNMVGNFQGGTTTQSTKELQIDCGDLLSRPVADRRSGVYILRRSDLSSLPIYVYCQVDDSGSVWTVIQRRKDGSVDFNRNWNDYKFGFGELTGEFWFGNNKINKMTSTRQYRLRIDMTDKHGINAFAEYSTFKVASEQNNFALTISGYYGNAGYDSAGLSYNNGGEFSTRDKNRERDANRSCAVRYQSGWWHKTSCTYANLNGRYGRKANESDRSQIFWYGFRQTDELQFVEMKIKRTS